MEKGATHYAHVFYPLTHLTAEKHDSFFEPGGRRQRHCRVRRQDADPGRAGRVELSQRRPPSDVRGPRLYRLGRDQPGLHPGEPERQHAVHPHRLRLDDRGGAGQQNPPAAVPAGHGPARRRGSSSSSGMKTPTRWCRSPAPNRSTSWSTAASSSAAQICSTPAARSLAPSPRRARSSTTTISGPFPNASWPT